MAIKVVDVAGGQEMQQFQQELHVLGHIRHLHIVKLLGACKEHGCLVYEFMGSGHLGDHLNSKSDFERSSSDAYKRIFNQYIVIRLLRI